MKRIFLIINPKAGREKSKTALYEMVSTFCKNECIVTVNLSQYRGHAEQLAKEASLKGEELIVCCGGDGTLNEVVSGVILSGKKTAIGYIPMGSTNDFADSMGIPLEPKRAIASIISGGLVPVDVGTFNGRYFTYIASFGAFTACSYKTPQEAKNMWGHLAYVFNAVMDIRNIVPYNVTINADNRICHGNYIFGAIGNSKSIGGVVKLKDQSISVNDGMFEVILIKPPKSAAQLAGIISGVASSDFSGDMFEFFKTSKLEISTDDKFDWSLDGEFAGGEKLVRIQNMHNAIMLKQKT